MTLWSAHDLHPLSLQNRWPCGPANFGRSPCRLAAETRQCCALGNAPPFVCLEGLLRRAQLDELYNLLSKADEATRTRYFPKGYQYQGKFDRGMIDAVTEYQREQGLTVDGEVGQQTWAALLGHPKPDSVPPGRDLLLAWNALAGENKERWNDDFTEQQSKILDIRSIDEKKYQGLRKGPLDGRIPMYKQGDIAWSQTALNNRYEGNSKKDIGFEGCAMCSFAMALSAIDGRPIYPAELDQFLDANGGYASRSNKIDWKVAAQKAAQQKKIVPHRQGHVSVELIRQQLSADPSKPVLLAVDYKNSRAEDHWICVKARALETPEGNLFIANDPATGAEVKLYEHNGTLVSFERGGIAPSVGRGLVWFEVEGDKSDGGLVAEVSRLRTPRTL